MIHCTLVHQYDFEMRRKAQQITSEHIHPEVKGREAFLLPEIVDA